MELLQSQAPAEWVLKGLECSRIKNLENRIMNQEFRVKNQELKAMGKCEGYNWFALSIPATKSI